MNLSKVEHAYKVFLDRFCRATPPERSQLLEERAVLRGEGTGKFLIPVHIAHDLLSKNLCGYSKERDQEGGQNRVFHKGGVHFKLAESSTSDINPAMEWAAFSFGTLFQGSGYIPPSATLILENVPFFKNRDESKIQAYLKAKSKLANIKDAEKKRA